MINLNKEGFRTFGHLPWISQNGPILPERQVHTSVSLTILQTPPFKHVRLQKAWPGNPAGPKFHQRYQENPSSILSKSFTARSVHHSGDIIWTGAYGIRKSRWNIRTTIASKRIVGTRNEITWITGTWNYHHFEWILKFSGDLFLPAWVNSMCCWATRRITAPMMIIMIVIWFVHETSVQLDYCKSLYSLIQGLCINIFLLL